MTKDELFAMIDPELPSTSTVEDVFVFEMPIEAVREPKKEKHAIRRVDCYFKWLKFWEDEVSYITKTYGEKISDTMRKRLIYCRQRVSHYKKLIKRYRAK